MYTTEILCPICKETHLRESQVSYSVKRNVDGTELETEVTRSFLICYSCKMTFFEKELLENQSRD